MGQDFLKVAPGQYFLLQLHLFSHQVAEATKFCTAATNVRSTSTRNFYRVTLLRPGTFRWLKDFFSKICPSFP